MRHLKKISESFESKRLTVEDIEDYFLEFIDNGTLSFYHSGISPLYGQNKSIHTTFVMNSKFCTATTIEGLNNFTGLINQIISVVKRWNLDFKFSTIAIGNKPGGGGPHQTQLSIIQPLPKVIIDNFLTPIETPRDTIYLDGFTLTYNKNISMNENSDFFMSVEIEAYRGGNGPNGRWSKKEYTKFIESESEFIKHFTDNKDMPCEFVKKIATSDLRYNQPFYSRWYFKLLV